MQRLARMLQCAHELAAPELPQLAMMRSCARGVGWGRGPAEAMGALPPGAAVACGHGRIPATPAWGHATHVPGQAPTIAARATIFVGRFCRLTEALLPFVAVLAEQPHLTTSPMVAVLLCCQ